MKNTLHTILTASALALGLVAYAAPAHADAQGDAVVQKMDGALKSYKTLTVQYNVTTQEPGKGASEMVVRSNFKGRKQFTELLSPGDVKGTKVLHLSESEMYVYMPAYRKIRRVASHVNEQGFMGGTYSATDMNLTQYSLFFTGQLSSEDSGSWTVTLTPKPDVSPPYGKVIITVAKSNNLPTTLKYFDDKNNHVKTETRTNYFCEGKVCLPKEQKMTDHTKGDKWTRLTLGEYKINPDLGDDMFSKRNLQH
jgi:outer membrane lipoprotein-sorting protein